MKRVLFNCGLRIADYSIADCGLRIADCIRNSSLQSAIGRLHQPAIRNPQSPIRNSIIVIAAALLIAFSFAPAASAQEALKLPPYKKVKLKNGMTLLLMEQHEVPIISFNFIVKAGSTVDPSGKEGLASVTAALLRKGTKSRSADQISAQLDFIGAVFSASASFDYSAGSAEFLKKDTDKALELFSDIVLNPTFPEGEVAKLLKQRIDGIKANKDEAQGVIGTYYNAYLFGNHPYGRPTGGDEKSLASIVRDDAVKFYENNYGPDNFILAAAGDFNASDMEKLLSEKFGAWTAKPAKKANIPDAAPAQGKRMLLVDKPDSTQTFFQFGNIGIARTNPDRVYIEIVNTLFGGRFTSMLNSELRIKTGLTYGAGSFFSERLARGPFVISTFTANATTEKAIDLALDVLKRLHEKGITEEELKSAKNYIKGQFPPDVETTDQLASLIAQLEFYGLDEKEINGYYSKIDSMTVEDARKIIKQYYPQDNLVFVLIGKADEIKETVKKYAGKIDTKTISEPGF